MVNVYDGVLKDFPSTPILQYEENGGKIVFMTQHYFHSQEQKKLLPNISCREISHNISRAVKQHGKLMKRCKERRKY